MSLQQNELTDLDIEMLLAKTEGFMNTMYYVKHDFNLVPNKQHIGTCINYIDLQEMRNEFVKELVATVIKYVYSKSSQRSIKEEYINEGRDDSDASMLLGFKASEKFRKSDVKGQFSELLLFNLLQYHFKAIPLLRKMSITTNPNVERHGADAIHIGKINNNYVLYLGEAKTYNRKQYALKSAIEDAVDSILENYNNHRNELNLYVYEEFIPKELESVAKQYLNGKLNMEVHLVCMITYDNSNAFDGESRDLILDNIISSITKEIKRVKAAIFPDIPKNLMPRFNYVIFPVNEMDELLELFKQKLGV